MTKLEILNKIFCDALNIKDISKITDEMGPDEIEDWDSLAHVELVTGLEEKFGIELNVIEISKMYTIGDVKKVLIKHEVAI